MPTVQPHSGSKIIRMLDIKDNVILVILIVGSALLFMMVLERLWPSNRRSPHNDIIGWQVGILGTTYAVILGFMLYTVWTQFGLAEINADSEASSIVNVYRLADGLPAQQRDQLREAARAYTDAVVQKDWPAMAYTNNEAAESTRSLQQMWQILMTVKAASPAEITAEDHALYELSTLTGNRRIRLLQCISRLPNILWCVLVVGAIITIASSCMFGSSNRLLHGLQVFAFSLLVALVLLAIADIDRPFQGTVHVSDDAFRRAQQSLKD